MYKQICFENQNLYFLVLLKSRPSVHFWSYPLLVSFSIKHVVPSNSQPLNNSNNINNVTRSISTRHPSGNRTKCGNDLNGNPDYENGNFVKFTPNPIRHWRKQLLPNQGIATRSRPTISELERPGGRNTLQFKEH